MSSQVENIDFVKCKICNKELKELNYHMKKCHSISCDEYIIRYPNSLIICKASSESKSKKVKENYDYKRENNISLSPSTETRLKIAEKSRELHQRKKAEDYDGYMRRQATNAEKARLAKGDNFKHSQETLEKMKGPRLQCRGIPKSEETKEKLSNSKKGKKTRPHTEETIGKMKESWLRRKENKEEYAIYTKTLSDNMSKNIKNGKITRPNSHIPTRWETWYMDFCNKNRIQYKYHYILEGKEFDFYLPEYNTLIELDNEYYHSLTVSIKNDETKNKIAENNDIKLIRISSDDCKSKSKSFEHFEQMLKLGKDDAAMLCEHLVEKRKIVNKEKNLK
jgi:hypothetical protein